ncbi:MAG TPA: hypothetical protein VJU18_01850 [Vicinamibacteria bacterium]|nr:hypothetical protein [Vicinamibacteria bacterium]
MVQRSSPGLSQGFFGPQGLLARSLPGYEERPTQERLAEAVGRVLRDGGLLLAEAGTGTGKTLAEMASVRHRAERSFKLLIGIPGRRLTPGRMSHARRRSRGP